MEVPQRAVSTRGRSVSGPREALPYCRIQVQHDLCHDQRRDHCLDRRDHRHDRHAIVMTTVT